MYHSQFRAAYHTVNGVHYYAATSAWGRMWYGTTYPEVYRNSDWAIIELEEPLGETQGYLGINPTDLQKQLPIYDKFELIGYSEDGYSQTAGKDPQCSLEDAYQVRRMNGARTEGSLACVSAARLRKTRPSPRTHAPTTNLYLIHPCPNPHPNHTGRLLPQLRLRGRRLGGRPPGPVLQRGGHQHGPRDAQQHGGAPRRGLQPVLPQHRRPRLPVHAHLRPHPDADELRGGNG